MPRHDNTYGTLASELNQSPLTRHKLYEEIEKLLSAERQKPVKVISFFTSFNWPVVITDADGDVIEETLQNSDLTNKDLVMIINSPGGEALAAERIVNICRSYSSGAFSVIVPKMAKSAATMICFGSNSVGMSDTSELGPVDPQIPIRDESNHIIDYRPAHEILESYNDLMAKANRTKGRLEPYLQQLARFDARDIPRIKYAQELSESISIKCLKTGQLKKLSEKKIKSKMKAFFDPTQTKVHGRPIYPDVVKSCGINVKLYPAKSPLWKVVWELYIRLDYVINSNHASKVVESSTQNYFAPAPKVRT